MKKCVFYRGYGGCSLPLSDFAYSDVPEDSDVYTTGYLPDETFDGFLTELLKSSYKDTGVAVGKDDKVLTLSTCSGDGLRFVVHAVRVDEHESGM